MVGIHQLDQDLVRPGREAVDNDRIAARVCPVPRGVIDRHMDVPDPGRNRERGRPEHRHEVQILRAILNHHPAMRQRFGQRRIDDDLRRWFALKRFDRRCTTHLPGGLRSGC